LKKIPRLSLFVTSEFSERRNFVPGRTSKTKRFIVYPEFPPALRPVTHNKEVPVPEKPEPRNLEDEEDDGTVVDLDDKQETHEDDIGL
jgi:hypothetical protein